MANGAAIHWTGETGRLPNRRSCKTISPQLSNWAWLGLGLTAVALIALSAGLVWHSDRQVGNLQHAYFTALSLRRVLSGLEAVEARGRQYLLAGEPGYLGSYSSSRKDLDDEFDRLRELVKDNPAEREQTERFRYLVYQKLDELEAAMRARDARATVLTRREPIMDAARQSVSGMEANQQVRLSGFSRDWRWRRTASLAALAGSALLACCCLLTGQIALVRSTSERQRAEQALAKSDSRFGTLCEQAPLGIYETDPEGNCIYTNRRWSTMSGLTASESLGHGWMKVLHPDDRAPVHERWKAAAQQGTTWEYRLLTGRDETRWVRAVGGPIFSAQGELTGYVGTLEDVTERRQAEERFRLVVETAPNGMVIVDQEGKVVLVNSRTEELFGCGRKELLGKPVGALVPELFQGIDAMFHGDVRADPQLAKTGAGRELHGQRKDGTRFPVEISLSPIDTGSGNLVLASIVDITERMRVERELQKSRQELRALAGRLLLAQEEERKRIARELHDDLSQKVALLAFDTSSLVLVPPLSTADMKKSLCDLQNRIADLSTDIRQIAHQLHPSVLEDLGLTAALRELCEEFSARETIRATFYQKEMPEALPVDIASCLYRVAQEALHNVQKHAPGATQVRLTISGDPDSVRLQIQDDGDGFDFGALKPAHGLGIISMKERVRLVQGEFSIHSQPGQGTTISVIVPLPRRQGEAHASSVSG